VGRISRLGDNRTASFGGIVANCLSLLAEETGAVGLLERFAERVKLSKRFQQ
jgi:hypothetical protein